MYIKEYMKMHACMYIVTWSTTERREIRDFPYPSVFELTVHQRLTVKKRNRNVGQFLAAEVTNPGQNESQQMFALCDRMDKEGGIWTYRSPNESPDRVKEEERGQMIGQYSIAEVAPFSSAEMGIKNMSFEDRCRREQTGESHAKLQAKKQNQGFQDNYWCEKMYWNCHRNSRGKAERILDKKITDAFKPSYIKPR